MMPKLPNHIAYNDYFYKNQAIEVASSANHLLQQFFSLYKPNSIVDVGCGSGAWINAAIGLGIQDVTGVDGAWAKNNPLIPAERFVEADLSRHLPQLNRSFDLAISLEVAEHLPFERSDKFVEYLTSLAPVVLFSAAIPGQGGANHINERWQSEWAELFKKYGFEPDLKLREKIWSMDGIDWWYKQNSVVYFNPNKVQASFQDKKIANLKSLNIVHPNYAGKYLRIIEFCNWIAAIIPQRIKNQITRFLIVKSN